jgi:hypothetical protein
MNKKMNESDRCRLFTLAVRSHSRRVLRSMDRWWLCAEIITRNAIEQEIQRWNQTNKTEEETADGVELLTKTLRRLLLYFDSRLRSHEKSSSSFLSRCSSYSYRHSNFSSASYNWWYLKGSTDLYWLLLTLYGLQLIMSNIQIFIIGHRILIECGVSLGHTHAQSVLLFRWHRWDA